MCDRRAKQDALALRPEASMISVRQSPTSPDSHSRSLTISYFDVASSPPKMSLTMTAFSSSAHSTSSSSSFFAPNHGMPVGRVAQGGRPLLDADHLHAPADGDCHGGATGDTGADDQHVAIDRRDDNILGNRVGLGHGGRQRLAVQLDGFRCAAPGRRGQSVVFRLRRRSRCATADADSGRSRRSQSRSFEEAPSRNVAFHRNPLSNRPSSPSAFPRAIKRS